MFHLFTKQLATISTIFLLLTGCGSDSASGPTGSQDTGTSTSCPTGRFMKSDYYGSITVGSTGLLHIVEGNARSTGYATCLGNTVVLTIEDVSLSLDEDPEARGMQVGAWQCEYSSSGNTFVVYCPSAANANRPGNIYRMGIEYFAY